MFFERLKAISRTLRFRLMLWNGGAVLLTGLAILVSVREGVRYTLLYDMDQVLSEDLEEIELSFAGDGNDRWQELLDQLNRKARGHKYHGWFVEFSDAAGQVVWSSVNSPEGLKIPRVLRSESYEADDATVAGYRLAYRRLPAQAKQAASVCVGCNQSFIERDMESIDRLVLLCGSVVLLISPLGGYALALRVTRPLADITQTAARLRPQELQERLPVRGTGDELDHLALTINGLLDRIADYLEQKHDFLANAAHELRTPLAAIRSSVEVALGGERTIEEYNELLGEVIDECASLESLVNQLLLLAESDADRLKSHGDPVELDQLVRKTLDMFQGVADVNGIRLGAAQFAPTIIQGNRHHLRQVLNNLLDNAIKFTASKFHGDEATPGLSGTGSQVHTGGMIVVQLNQDRSRNMAVLQIHDNGPGIPANQLPHVFERFYRVDRARSRDRGVRGTGLGLSICQAIIAAHRGTISVNSEPGKGTTFSIELPMAPAASRAELAASAGRPA